eukprot:CAMPEP_0119272896 /NCGR_PEP_ID=MMETSP1329-20130426/9134_1 /TAXON_ID=114041 /ORGANISM="Genus nov. species nov., Strain RCC1024" /LENGTH=171 /DNA_ID=CAMNT_0007273009 /DNA_START=200 /DNA_END=715 /DNA_ORIENTATION=+
MTKLDCLKREHKENDTLTKCKALVDASATPIVVTDAAEGRIVHCNEAWVAMCGYSVHEALGRTNKELLQGPETDRAAARDMVRSLRGPGCARARAVLRNYKKNGTAFWNDLIVLHLGDAASSGVSGYDLAFLREARGPADAEDARLSEAFGLKRRLAPFTGELAEASVLAH